MRNNIASFQYLTQDMTHRSHEEQVHIACKAGIRWIQLRIKTQSFEDWLKTAKEVRRITNDFNATLIINDSVEIAGRAEANGVHLGKEDMSWEEARKILGDEKIIGHSVHSWEELGSAKDFDVDYFGIGPFRFTSTKKNLDPVLGLEGIREITMKAKRSGITKPLIAIGGIQRDDVRPLMEAGLHGVAVSSAINMSGNPEDSIRAFLNQFDTINFSERNHSGKNQIISA